MDEFTDHAEEIAQQYISALGLSGEISKLRYGYGEHIFIEHGIWCCGSFDADETMMPTHFLWTPDWRDEIERIRTEREAQRKADNERREAERLESKRKAELKRLAELKAKYEQED